MLLIKIGITVAVTGLWVMLGSIAAAALRWDGSAAMFLTGVAVFAAGGLTSTAGVVIDIWRRS